jgi:ATP-dependent Clp protease adapter protein ClpS
MASTIEAPEKTTDSTSAPDEGWKVTVYNNETNTYEEVMTILQVATGCDAHEAYIETWEIDHFGQCVVHRADEAACVRAAEIIAVIGIRVEAGPA